MEEATQSEVVDRFAPPGGSLDPAVMGELQSMLRLHSTSPQELFYKWESYSIKMGAEETKLDLKTARAFKVDLQESLERENRSKTHLRTAEKRGAATGTPRNVGSDGDVFGMRVPRAALAN